MSEHALATPILQVRGLCKRFAGIVATDHLDLDILPTETHAIIGPNGAGKSTLIAQLSGQLEPDAGTVHFDGRDVTRLPAYRRAPIGIARSFQVTSVFTGMRVIDNVALACQAHDGHSFRLWRPAAHRRHVIQAAEQLLHKADLAGRANDSAETLSHGERRQLEIAMALAGEPKILLLDEPMAGMGADESGAMVRTLQSLTEQAIVLIEHDMDAVFALADRISVLVYGRIIATGTPAAIRANEDVRRAYLGEMVECCV